MTPACLVNARETQPEAIDPRFLTNVPESFLFLFDCSLFMLFGLFSWERGQIQSQMPGLAWG